MATTPKRAAAKKTPARAAKSRATPSRAAAPRITSPVRPKAQDANIYTSPPIDIAFAGPEHRSARIDLEIDGIFHGEVSYQGRIFLNNPKAGPDTPKTPEAGYAGSFNIFGHGGCVGDAGHCEVAGTKRAPNDLRYPHPLTPAKKRVRVTETLKTLALGADKVTITVVPVVTATNELCDTTNVFRCDGMRFVAYNA